MLIMCRSRSQMSGAKAATVAIFFLVLVGFHTFSALGEETDGGGSSNSSKRVVVVGLCVDSPCFADPNRTCFCCTRLANEPCYDTLKQCEGACPVCSFPTCPLPAAAARRVGPLGSAPASP